MQADCSANAFCSSLSPDLRERLCACCARCTLAAGSSISAVRGDAFLALSGICAHEGWENLLFVARPGDLVFPPSPEGGNPNKLLVPDFIGIHPAPKEESRHIAVTDVRLVMFREKAIHELCNNADFAMALYYNFYEFVQHMLLYDVFVNKGDAYGAVRYVVALAKRCGVQDLTHAQISYLTGRARSTVTQALHELALAEPDIFSIGGRE